MKISAKVNYKLLFLLAVMGILIMAGSLSFFSSCTTFYPHLRVLDNDTADEILEKGRLWYSEQRKFKRAIETFEIVLERYPGESIQCAWAYYEIGISYYKMREFEVATEYFNIVLNDYPEQTTQGRLSELLLGKIEREETRKNASYSDDRDTDEENEDAPFLEARQVELDDDEDDLI